MTIETNGDLYRAMRDLAVILEEGGEHELAVVVREALVVSTAPGEVLGESLLALERIRHHDAYGRLKLTHRIDEGIAYIRAALGV